MLELAANDPLIKTYLKDLQRLKGQDVIHELGLRGPFQNLLDKAARKRGWTLVPELSTYSGGKRVVPDGTVRDEFRLARGWWRPTRRVGDGDHLIPGRCPAPSGRAQGVSAVSHSDSVGGPAISCEGALKGFHFRPEDICPAFQHARHRCADIRLMGAVLGERRGERDHAIIPTSGT